MANPWILDPNQQLQLISKPGANRGQLSWAHAKKIPALLTDIKNFLH